MAKRAWGRQQSLKKSLDHIAYGLHRQLSTEGSSQVPLVVTGAKHVSDRYAV